MPRPTFATVADYIAAQPPPTRAALKKVRATIRKALPRATEGISYQIPVYKLDGRMVLYFAGYANHYSIYPATSRLLAALGKQHTALLHHKATLRFPLDEPVPVRLITRIAELRAAETREVGGTKRRKRKAR